MNVKDVRDYDSCVRDMQRCLDRAETRIDMLKCELAQARADTARIVRDYDAVIDDRDAEIARLRESLEGIAEGDCSYGDQCPTFGSRHGTCVSCRARAALSTREEGEKK